MKTITLLALACQFAYAEVVPREILSVSVCDVGDKVVDKTIETQGSLTRFRLPEDTVAGDPNLIISDAKNCPKQTPIIVDLSRCLTCQCSDDFDSKRIWNAIKELRNSPTLKTATVSLRADVKKANAKKYSHSLEVECIKEIKVE